MSRNQFGNNLLYLLSEKKSVKWNQFFQYIESLHLQKNYLDDKYKKYSFVRKLSSLGHLDMGEDENGNTIIKIAPPMLVDLPFIRPTFFLTGARSPSLLQIIKSGPKFEVKRMENKYLPDNIIIRPENIKTLESWIEKTVFQGNPLSSYIKMYQNPTAWSILEFSGDLKSYEQRLDAHWFSGNEEHIQKIFDVDDLEFKEFNIQRSSTYNNLSLVKISHHESFYKCYLFNFKNKDRVKVNLDWGRFLIAKKSNKSVLKYNSKTFDLISFLRLPLILERGLTLLSGNPPTEREKSDRSKKAFIFKNVPHRIAMLIADKLGQELKEIHSERRVA